jgi:hypothetical protein
MLRPFPARVATLTVSSSAHSETARAGAKIPVRRQRQVSTKAVVRAGCLLHGYTDHGDAAAFRALRSSGRPSRDESVRGEGLVRNRPAA